MTEITAAALVLSCVSPSVHTLVPDRLEVLAAADAMPSRCRRRPPDRYGGDPADEHADLTGFIASRAGLPAPEADARATKVENDARAAADTARRVAMRLAFWTVAAMS